MIFLLDDGWSRKCLDKLKKSLSLKMLLYIIYILLYCTTKTHEQYFLFLRKATYTSPLNSYNLATTFVKYMLLYIHKLIEVDTINNYGETNNACFNLDTIFISELLFCMLLVWRRQTFLLLNSTKGTFIKTIISYSNIILELRLLNKFNLLHYLKCIVLYLLK